MLPVLPLPMPMLQMLPLNRRSRAVMAGASAHTERVIQLELSITSIDTLYACWHPSFSAMKLTANWLAMTFEKEHHQGNEEQEGSNMGATPEGRVSPLATTSQTQVTSPLNVETEYYPVCRLGQCQHHQPRRAPLIRTLQNLQTSYMSSLDNLAHCQ